MKNTFLPLFLNTYVIALIIALVVIFFSPNYFTKYKVELVNQEIFRRNSTIYFEDLNNDHNSEKIICYHNNLGNASFEIHNPNGDLIDQWNFTSKHASPNKLWFFDVDGNGYNEIYLITQKKDSVFLNIEEPFVKDGIHKKNIFIDLIKEYDGKFVVKAGKFMMSADTSKHGANEIFFYLMSGFSGYPRSIYKYNIENNIIAKSPHLTNTSHIYQIIDLDNDNEKEIILRNHSAANTIDSSYTDRSDYSSWLTVLNKDLNFRFEPIEYKSEFSSIQTIPFKSDKEYKLLVLLNSKQSEKYPDKLCIYSNKGILLLENILVPGAYNIFSGSDNKEFILYEKDKGKIQTYTYNLKEIETLSIEPKSMIYPLDLHSNGEIQWLLKSSDQTTMRIFQKNFKNPIEFSLSNGNNIRASHDLKKTGKNKNQLYFQEGNYYFVYSYGKNPIYFFKYLIYLGIFLGVSGIVWLIQLGQKIRMQKQRKIEKQIAELQIKTIKNQVDPHFVFNAINTISEMTLTEDKMEADKFICRFSDFMRETLRQSDQISCTLKEELDFVENFIQLQQVRYYDSFKYEYLIDKDIHLETTVPKHVIFSYVENAIKHGLSNKNEKGLLKIKANNKNGSLLLSVEDNGTGIISSNTQRKNSTGNGFKIMEQMFQLYSKLYKKNIRHQVIELFDKKKKKNGIRVEILISKKL